MFYPDLSTACLVDAGPEVRSVGWLGKCDGIRGFFGARHPFTVGQVDATFLSKLRDNVQNAVQVVLHPAGFHTCEFCKDQKVPGLRNVWIPTRTFRYVAPEMVTHYVEAHHYRPPQEFIDAVKSCPPQGSAEFWELLAGFEKWWGPQPYAPPNGGPAARFGNTRVPEGPPSVS